VARLQKFLNIISFALRVVLAIAFACVLIWFVVLSDRGDRQVLQGQARIIDGDSIEISDTKIRLVGIDAPELDQECDKKGRNWKCGQEAKSALSMFVANQVISCESQGLDKYRRVLGNCSVRGRNLGKWMVTNGWAVSFGDYSFDEAIARRNKFGIWQGSFEKPQDWRRRSGVIDGHVDPMNWLCGSFGN